MDQSDDTEPALEQDRAAYAELAAQFTPEALTAAGVDPALIPDAIRLFEQSREFATTDRRIGLDTITTRRGPIEVSTVNLMYDYDPPFETMISPRDGEPEFRRYPTREDAADGHARIVSDLHTGNLAPYFGDED